MLQSRPDMSRDGQSPRILRLQGDCPLCVDNGLGNRAAAWLWPALPDPERQPPGAPGMCRRVVRVYPQGVLEHVASLGELVPVQLRPQRQGADHEVIG